MTTREEYVQDLLLLANELDNTKWFIRKAQEQVGKTSKAARELGDTERSSELSKTYDSLERLFNELKEAIDVANVERWVIEGNLKAEKENDD